eukprot:COSAG02_NODE_5657_length_4148_cov_3.339096_1_plen_840_part_10
MWPSGTRNAAILTGPARDHVLMTGGRDEATMKQVDWAFTPNCTSGLSVQNSHVICSGQFGDICRLVCEPGFHVTHSGVRTCELNGSFTGSVCRRCTLGRVSDGVACVDCIAGMAADANATRCTACDSGFFAPPRSVRCIACDGGLYDEDSNSSTPCLPCPIGRFSNSGMPTLKICPVCAPGRYSGDRAGMSTCLNCSNGFWDDDANASTACAACPAGRVTRGGGGHLTCSACQPGQYAPSGSTWCEVCAANSYDADLNAATECITCGVGNYTESYEFSGAVACLPCGEGRVDHDRISSTQCVRCSAGRYAHTQSSVGVCSDCPAGRWSLLESSACAPCPFGYTSLPRSSACHLEDELCPGGACLNGGSCVDANACTMIAAAHCGAVGMASCANRNHDCVVPGFPSNDTYYCMCQFGFSGWRCETDVDECGSDPCHNNARCSDSNSDSSIDAGTYQCACVHGYASGESGNCDIDVDECASAPCQNGAACADSTTNSSVPTGGYRCSCVDGYTSGTCEYSPVVEAYADSCAIALSSGVSSPGDGNCAVDVDECASHPCQNDGVCFEHVSDWSCQCVAVLTDAGTRIAAYGGEHCQVEVDVCRSEHNDCDPFHATCHALGPGLHSCSCHVGWLGDGHSCADVDECLSGPCQNGAVCLQSNCTNSSYLHGQRCSAGLDDTRPPVDRYRCECKAGFANGLCVPGWDTTTGTAISEHYQATCNLETGGRCDIDIDECMSSPCRMSATCTDSQHGVAPNAYSCSCSDGWASGICSYDFIPQYMAACTVADSSVSESLGGNCDIDVDECASAPCHNGAACADSTTNSSVPTGGYRCSCVDGYTSGTCE